MPILKVLLNEQGEVIGTAQSYIERSGQGAPDSVMLVASSGQVIVEIEIDDIMASSEPRALHAALQAHYGEKFATNAKKMTKSRSEE